MCADTAPGRDVKRPMRTRRGAAGALGQRWCPAGDAHGAQQIGVQQQVPRPLSIGHRPQRAHREPVQSRSGRPLLTGQAFGGFQYRASAGVAAVIGDDVGGERVDRDNLGDDVEVAARVQLHLDMRERLQARAEFAAGASNTFGHRADQPVIAGQQGDDPVGFAELVLAQHNSPVPIQPHHNSFAPRHDIAGIRADSLVPVVGASGSDAGAISGSGNQRLPTLTDLLYQLATRAVTSEELVRRSLRAIDVSQPTLNAFRVVLTESALADAAAADKRRAAGDTAPLLGIPIAVKDDVDVAGVPTAFGTQGYVAPATDDCEVVRRLKAAGAVIVGKTNTCELGQWPFTSGPGFGHTRNPWSRRHTPGGSSGGSAAAVAAGLVTAAIGSDGAGSIRIPAAWTHLVGIKPQRGRISTWPLPEAFNGVTVNGVLARTVEDAALVLDAASGNVEGDRHQPPR